MPAWKTSKRENVPPAAEARIKEAVSLLKAAEKDCQTKRQNLIRVMRQVHRKDGVSIQMIAWIAGVSRSYVHRVVNQDRQ